MPISNYSRLTEFSLALTAGILLPLGLPPLSLWPLTLLGAALIFSRCQLNTYRIIGITLPGFITGYVVTEQFWLLCHQIFSTQVWSGSFIAQALLYQIFLPAVLMTAFLALYPLIRHSLRISRFSAASAILFACIWVLFEETYTA